MRVLVVVLLFCGVLAKETCNMDTCFDRCTAKKIYIHPVTAEFQTEPVSKVFQQIYRFLRGSKYYTENPHEACIFILGIDTIDRDPKSHNYVSNVNAYIASLGDAWKGGRNHLIFNFYHGTYPDYREDLSFDPGEAMLARASANVTTFRRGFDVSFPLFHENHPFDIERKIPEAISSKKYLLTFKGKRYVYGIGSNTRNVVHHLHDGERIIMLTTCKHNNDWQNYQDERCEADNSIYESWDYAELLHNSTFCLVPRGRRLGSFRFLEVAQAGCIPVVISDGWALPFNDQIDWSAAAVLVDEAESLLTPSIVMMMARGEVERRRDAVQAYYREYLRSVSVITKTALRTIFDRITVG